MSTLGREGFTLIEVLVASLISAVVAGGTLTAFVTAARLARQASSPASLEAAAYAQQTLEEYRNMIACDSAWFDSANCTVSAGLPSVWTNEPLPAGGTESIQNLGGGAKRCYRVNSADCDGNGTTGDCFQVEVVVCWNDFTGCPCP